MEQEQQPEEERAAWQQGATVLVLVLAVLAFAYIAMAYHTQRTFSRLMAELVSPDEEVSKKAADELASTDGALPYLSNALVHAALPEKRVLCATVILRRVEATRTAAGVFEDKEHQQRALRSGLNLEAITKGLQDESALVRTKAREILQIVGMEQTYQKNRLDEMVKFESLLTKLGSEKTTEQDEAGEELREAGVRSLPYLVGVVFSSDDVFRLRGLKALRTVVQDVLRGSNQRRIVTLIGRRRCQLLLREMVRLSESDRSVITDILNVSGRVPETFFTRFLKEYAALDEEDARRTLLTERIEVLEEREKTPVAGEELREKVKRLHGATGERS
ncbi:MAG: hypothetical protein AMS16_05375 [Planctomycetes bacterium DG_58]|nr:MAG: hypothetical protein AMS16_05375 [Planctomycetes bacterium DG_58]